MFSICLQCYKIWGNTITSAYQPLSGVKTKPILKNVSGYEDSPYRIEWMRFEPDCPLPELVKTVPHVAFEVDDLAAEIKGKEILIEPNSPSQGVTVAFIIDNGAPVEFLQIDKRNDLIDDFLTWINHRHQA